MSTVSSVEVTILSRCYLRMAYTPISVVMISTSRPLDTYFILTKRASYAQYLSKKRVRIIASPLAFRSRLSRAFQPHFSAYSFRRKERYFDNHLLHGRAKLQFLKQTRQKCQKSKTIKCMGVTVLLNVRNDYQFHWLSSGYPLVI